MGVDAEVEVPRESLVGAPQAFSIALRASLAFEVRVDVSGSLFLAISLE